jgi:short-subunit dehydrogenase
MHHPHAFVLGGTKGLGHELAKKALLDGKDVTIAGRDARDCELTTSTDTKLIERLRPYTVDLTASSQRYPFPPFPRTPVDFFFWNAGQRCKGALEDLSSSDIASFVEMSITRPVQILNHLFRAQRENAHPLHLIVISSVTSWRIRSDETLYGGMKAAQAQIARNLGREWPEGLPGTKVLLVHPGGMRTTFWEGSGSDTSQFLDPALVAEIIWKAVNEQTEPFQEMQVLRQVGTTIPVIEYGAKKPE